MNIKKRVASLVLIMSIPMFGSSSYNLKDDHFVIIEVLENPVAIKTNIDSSRSCDITCSLLQSRAAKIHKGKTLKIKVMGDNDIIIKCNGSKGITISRD